MGHILSYPLAWVIYSFGAMLGGFNLPQLDIPRFSLMFKDGSMTVPPKLFFHSCQYITQDVPFSKFDYGKERNSQIYGQEKPPLYDISKITNDEMAFFYSKNDWAADVVDVQFATSQLKGRLLRV